MVEISTTAPQEQVVVDVTGWAWADRAELISAINKVRTRIEASEPYEASVHGWTKEAMSTLLTRLSGGRGHVAAAALTAAIRNGGYVSREDVYQLGGFSPERSLKGFTRPVNRIVQKMRDNGEVPEDAVDPFEAVFDPDVTGYRPAQGFRVPSGIVALYDKQAVA